MPLAGCRHRRRALPPEADRQSRCHVMPAGRPLILAARTSVSGRLASGDDSHWCRYSYMPMRPAPLVLHVDIGGRPVQGSPYAPFASIAIGAAMPQRAGRCLPVVPSQPPVCCMVGWLGVCGWGEPAHRSARSNFDKSDWVQCAASL
jgi:hypothetical protein